MIMNEISLVPVGEGCTGAKLIPIPEGKTTIGRGSFLQVSDRRVSRNHAVLEVSQGNLFITPMHTNPCFFKKSSISATEVLKKDERRRLENSQIFGLLPDCLYFRVICPVTQNGISSSNDKTEEEIKTGSKVKEETQATVKQKPNVEKPDAVMDMTTPPENMTKLPDQMAEPDTEQKKDEVEEGLLPYIKKSPAKAVSSRKRKGESDEDEDFAVDQEVVTEKITTKRGRGTVRRKYVEENDEDEDWEVAEEDYKPKRRTPAKPRPTPKARPQLKAIAGEVKEKKESEDDKPKLEQKDNAKSDNNKNSSENEEPSTSSRAQRAARAKRQSYVDEFIEFSDDEDFKGNQFKDKDSDFVADDGEDSTSDWEVESQRSSGRKGSKAAPSRRSLRTVGRQQKYKDPNESFSEEEYVPKSAKKRQAPSSKKLGGKKKKDSSIENESSSFDYVAPKRDEKTKKKQGSGEEEEAEEDEVVESKSKTARTKKMKEDKDFGELDHDDNDNSDDDANKKDKRDEIQKVRQLKSTNRPPCMFGKKCYRMDCRKNTEHFTEFSHPGDVSFDEQSDVNDDDDKRPDCPYGNSCDRTTASHLKQYKHIYTDQESKQEAKAASKEKCDGEEETGPYTSDTNDSSVNDKTENQPEDKEEETPSKSENMGKLKAEVKS